MRYCLSFIIKTLPGLVKSCAEKDKPRRRGVRRQTENRQDAGGQRTACRNAAGQQLRTHPDEQLRKSTRCTARLKTSSRGRYAAPANSRSCAQTETPSTLRQAQQPYSAAAPPSAAKSAHPALTSSAALTAVGGSGSTASSTAPTMRKNTTHPQTDSDDVTAEDMACGNPLVPSARRLPPQRVEREPCRAPKPPGCSL